MQKCKGDKSIEAIEVAGEKKETKYLCRRGKNISLYIEYTTKQKWDEKR